MTWSRGECYAGRRPVADALMSLLGEKGVCVVGLRVPFEARKVVRLGFQYVGVEMLVRGYGVDTVASRGRTLHECSGMRIIGGRGDEEAGYSVVKEGRLISREDLLGMLPSPPIPMIAIDLGLLGLHTEEEASSLRIQLAMSLSVVRSYLWDRHLALTRAREGVEEWLKPVTGRNMMIITRESPGELFWRLKIDNVIVLRPDAREKLTPRDLLEAEGFLIGGIVDKIPRPGVSRILDMLVPWGKARRIELRGSIIGVPARINRLVELLLRARLDYMGDLERAIVDVMTRADRVNRLYYELVKRKVKRINLCRALEEFSWLRPEPKDIVLAAKRARVEVEGDACTGSGGRQHGS